MNQPKQKQNHTTTKHNKQNLKQTRELEFEYKDIRIQVQRKK